MTYESLLTLLGLIAVVSPLLLTIVLGVSSLLDWKLAEQTTSNLVFVTIVSGLAAAYAGIDLDADHGHSSCRHRTWEIGWRSRTSTTFRSSLSSIACRFRSRSSRIVLAGTIGAFATKYMHRERGFNRFFVLYALFVLGMEVTSLAGTIETLVRGLGICGALFGAAGGILPGAARSSA